MANQPIGRPLWLIFVTTLVITASKVSSQNPCDPNTQCYLDKDLLDDHLECIEIPYGDTDPPCYQHWSYIYDCTCGPGYRISSSTGSYWCDTGYGWDDLYTIECYAPCLVDAGPNVIAVNSSGTETDLIRDGEYVMYSCPTDYSGSGSSVVVCEDGVWGDHAKYTCSASCFFDEIDDGCVVTGGYGEQTDKVVDGSAVGMSCADGYTGYTITTVCDNGTFEDQCNCEASPCDGLLLEDDLVVQTPSTGPHPNGTTVHFSCPNGFELHGRSDDVCLYGSWNASGWLFGEEPSCSASPCDELLLEDNSVEQTPSTGPYPNGTTVTFSCPYGFELHGRSDDICLYGNWNSSSWLFGEEPSCSGVDSSNVTLFCGATYIQVDIPYSMVALSVRETDLYFAGDPYTSVCRGFRNGDYITLNTSLTGCGTVYSENHNLSDYKNMVGGLNIMDNSSSAIVEYMDLEIPVTCEFDRSAQLQAHFSTINNILVKKEKGTFQYDFSIYESGAYSQRYDAYPVVVSLGSRMYFRAELLRSPGNLQIHLRSCHATPTEDYDDPIMYPIISSGCGVGHAEVRVLNPEQATQADFEITSFRFAHSLVQNNNEVWVHCEVVLCDIGDIGSECSQGCEQPRSHRSVDSSNQRVRRMAQGPIILGGSSNQYGTFDTFDRDATSGTQNIITAGLALFSLSMFAYLLVVGVARIKRRLHRNQYQTLEQQKDVE